MQSVLNSISRHLKKQYQFYLIILLPMVYLIIFHYIPMAGAVLAFKDYNIRAGIWASEWVGFKYFNMFFKSPQFKTLIKNTLFLSMYQLAVGFPVPIILAIALNEVGNVKFKKTVQLVTYAPYFISTVVLVGMIMQFLDPRVGIINKIIQLFGYEAKNFMGDPNLFRTIYVLSGVWQTSGYNAIVYIAALTSIDPELHEAATIDGATRFQRILHVDIPGIMPTIIVILILESGKMMNIGFEKVFLMQNDMNLINSEIISTYVYKLGLLNAQFSYSTAIGLFNSVVNLIIIMTVNQIAKRYGDVSIW